MRRNRAQTIIATLIAVVIMLVLAVALMYGSGMFGGKPVSSRKDGLGTTIPGAVKYKAKDEVCRSNLGQVRQSLQIAWTTDESYPETIDGTRLGSTFYSCPLGNEPYLYDPQNGTVFCPHPGHEKF